jgi:hypothetical protein
VAKQARFADTGFAADQDYVSVPFRGLSATLREKADLAVATDELRADVRGRGFETQLIRKPP